jgi:hypothetical protein
VTNSYTTSTDTFSDLGVGEASYASSDYSQMDGFVTTASRLIDAEFGRWAGFFYPTTDTATYYYDGSGEHEQDIDEFVSISAVSVSEYGGLASTDYTSWTLNTDYITQPYNATAKCKPITKLVIQDYNGTKGAFYGGQKSVQVQGIPGYSTTPPDVIVQACKLQASLWFMAAKQGFQQSGATETIGALRYVQTDELDPRVRKLLAALKLELG